MLRTSLSFLLSFGSSGFRFYLLFSVLNVFFLLHSHAQQFPSLRGVITDAETHQPLPGASVRLLQNGEGITADTKGNYKFDKLPLGRYTISISFIGYKTVVVPEVLLESNKEQLISIALVPSRIALEEMTVSASKPDFYGSVEAITVEQTLRYAATYLDPARVATSFAGVAAANDQANGLVIRGNSPNGMQWRLEGVEIVNPNHHSNAGTFSDRPTQTGGGVNILSTQMLGTSYFLSGAFPAAYGNVLSGVMDMSLRKGNDEQHEFTAQAGVIGIDLAAEGPLSKKSKASYLANYRYSFTGLLGLVGVDFGGEKIDFQDLAVKVNFPTRKAGEFAFFGLGGLSSNVFKGENDSTLWEKQKDLLAINFRNKMGVLGATNSLSLGKKTGLHSVLVYSGLSSTRTADGSRGGMPLVKVDERDRLDKTRLSFSSTITHRFNAAHRIKAGLYLTRQTDAISIQDKAESLKGNLLQPFATWQWSLSKKLTTEAGLHYLAYTANHSGSLEPRASVRWQADSKQIVNFSYGLHSQTQLPQTYLGGPVLRENIGLGLTKAHHFVAGYQYNFSKGSNVKVEGYIQNLFNVPVSLIPSGFSALNLVERQVNESLTNKGKGRNQGVEVTVQQYLTNSYYFLVSGSVYQSRYVGSDGIWRNARFDGRHTFSFTGGKEFKRNHSTWGINLKVLWLGGFRDTPIDVLASSAAGTTVYQEDKIFSVKLKDYFRPDLRVYWKKSKLKYNRTLALDIQNVSATENEAFSYYDTFLKRIVRQQQMGMVPVLSYRWEF